MKTTHMPPSHCPHCGREATAASDFATDATPTAGDISVCIGCGGVAVFGEDLKLERLSDDEWAKLLADPKQIAEVRRHQRAVAKLSSLKPEEQ